MTILKRFAKGLGYIVLLPIFLVVLAIYAVIGIAEFIYIGTKSIIYFFSGRNLFGDFPEDIQAKNVMSGKDVASVEIATNEVKNNQPSEYYTFSNDVDSFTSNNKDEDNGVDINNMNDSNDIGENHE